MIGVSDIYLKMQNMAYPEFVLSFCCVECYTYL